MPSGFSIHRGCGKWVLIPLVSFDTTPLPPFDKGDFSFLKKSLEEKCGKKKLEEKFGY
jgi:hypothetical protein